MNCSLFFINYYFIERYSFDDAFHCKRESAYDDIDYHSYQSYLKKDITYYFLLFCFFFNI